MKDLLLAINLKLKFKLNSCVKGESFHPLAFTLCLLEWNTYNRFKAQEVSFKFLENFSANHV